MNKRVGLLEEEGIEFRTGVNVGVDYSVEELRGSFDAVCLCGGSTHARELNIPGRELDGIHLAMEYLPQQNMILSGNRVDPARHITAEGKRVVILGGGDTGADCLGTAHRQGAKTVYQFELLPEPPETRPASNPWPQWPLILRSSAAHEEGGTRDYSISTRQFSGSGGKVEKLHGVRLDWSGRDANGRPSMAEIPGSEFAIDADLVLLAMGFLHPEHGGMLEGLGVDLDRRGNVNVDETRMTSVPGIFAAGDMARGQSLVVWAIAEGREAAHHMDRYLMGSTLLPRSFT